MRNSTMRNSIKFAGMATLAGALWLAAAPATAAHAASARTGMQLDCAGSTVTAVSPSTHDNWAAAQIVGGGHIIAVSFDFSYFDDTAQVLLGDELVSHPHAHGQQQTITCTASQDAVLSDIAPPDQQFPDDVKPTDIVTMTFTVEAISLP